MKKIIYRICLLLLLSSHVWAQDTNKVQVDVLTKTSSSWNGKTLPNYTGGQPEITILKIIIPPKIELPLHKHPVINAAVLLKGKLTVVTKNQKTLHIKAGESMVEVIDTWHLGKNEGTEPAEIIVFYAGIVGMPITITQTTSK